MERLEQFAAAAAVDLRGEWTVGGRRTPSLLSIVDELAADVGPAPQDMIAVVHGDFCFSNIMFDFRTQRVKLIDPRGLDHRGRPSLYGDTRYETAKLHHSVIGLYDHILAGAYRLRSTGARALELDLPVAGHVSAVQHLFQATSFGGRSLDATQAEKISVLLFLSMLPLHADDETRQRALLANALRLYSALERREAA